MFGPTMYSAATVQENKAKCTDGALAILFLSFSVQLCTLRPESYEKQYSTWTELSPISSWHFQSWSVLCGQNSRRNSTVHGRKLRHFLPGSFSPAVYSAARIPGTTATYMDGILAIFFLAFPAMLCTLRSESKEKSKVHGQNSRQFVIALGPSK